jgi:hypothetical protein
MFRFIKKNIIIETNIYFFPTTAYRNQTFQLISLSKQTLFYSNCYNYENGVADIFLFIFMRNYITLLLFNTSIGESAVFRISLGRAGVLSPQPTTKLVQPGLCAFNPSCSATDLSQIT